MRINKNILFKRRGFVPGLLYLFQFVLLTFPVCGMSNPVRTYNVTGFGAKGDGKALDTQAINKAIEKAAEDGGGTVYFPAGSYLSFSIHLKSNVGLFLDQGATLVAASEKEHQGSYDAPEPNVWGDSLKYQDFGHSHWHNSLIWGEGLENISILGPGTIWGKGLTLKNKVPEGGGNKTIALKNCHNVTIRDVTILHGGHFAILATAADNLTLDNLKIDTNRDAIDVDCCKNVHISNCSVNAPGDDAICLKSSYALGYARPTENVTITNCMVSGYDEGTFYDGTFKTEKYKGYPDNNPTGRIKFGTESNGGFKNITITNCLFYHCRGLCLETVDGGLLEDVTITNITMRDIRSAPIFLRLGARMRGPEDIPVGELRRVMISNVVAYDVDPRFGVIVVGVPGHPIKDVSFNNIKIYYKGGGTSEMAATMPEDKPESYPEPFLMGVRPSYGFFIRHAENVELNGVQVSTMMDDKRPAFILDDVNGGGFSRIKATRTGNIPVFRITGGRDINVKGCQHVEDQYLEDVGQSEL